MAKHLARDLENLQARLVEMAVAVEQSLYRATQALLSRDAKLAREVEAGDDAIDDMENAIQEECLKMLALHQPVAVDLRRIMVVFHVTTDLERIGDLAYEIAERVVAILPHADVHIPDAITRLTDLVATMVRQSLDAFGAMDSAQARRVIRLDDEADRLSVEAIQAIIAQMKATPALVDPCVSLFSVARHLERVGDHATNVAEDVMYLVDAELIRHRSGLKTDPT